MIAAGLTLTLDVQGTAGQWVPRTTGEVRAQVVDALTPNFHVFDIQLRRETLLSDPENLYYWNWPYTAVVTLQTRESYGDASDVAAIVAHAFYDAAGSVPTSTVRGSGEQQGPAATYEGLQAGSALVWLAVAAAAVLVVLYVPRLRS